MKRHIRFIAVFTALTLLFSSFMMPSASHNDKKFDSYINMGQNSPVPNLFRQNAVYSNIKNFPLVVQNGVEYVPLSVFILFPYVEVNYSQNSEDFFLVNSRNNHYISFKVSEGLASTYDGDLLKMPVQIFNKTRYVPARTVAIVLGFVCETYDDSENGIYAFRVSDGKTGKTIEDLLAPYIEALNPKTPSTEQNPEDDANSQDNKGEQPSSAPEVKEPADNTPSQTPEKETTPSKPAVQTPEKNPAASDNKDKTNGNASSAPQGTNTNVNKPDSTQNGAVNTQTGQNPTVQQPQKPEDPLEKIASRKVALCYADVSYNNMDKLLDDFDRYGIIASFSFTDKEILEKPDILRRIYFSGHGLFVTGTASGETAEEYADSFIQSIGAANEAMKLVLKRKTRMCSLPYDMPQEIKTDEVFLSKIRDAGYLVFQPNLDTGDKPGFSGNAYSISAKIKNMITDGFDADTEGVVSALAWCTEKTYYYSVDLSSLVRKYERFEFVSMDEAFLNEMNLDINN